MTRQVVVQADARRRRPSSRTIRPLTMNSPARINWSSESTPVAASRGVGGSEIVGIAWHRGSVESDEQLAASTPSGCGVVTTFGILWLPVSGLFTVTE